MSSYRHQDDTDNARNTTGNEHLNWNAHLHNGRIIWFMLHRILTSTHKHKPTLSNSLF